MEGKDFTEPVAVMYKGTLRIFLVILHDYPAFLIENHYILCNAIPSSFVQLRNLVLSAFPDNIQLPDPLTEGLKVDRLPEVKEAPVLAIDPGAELQRFGLKKLVDQYIKSPSPAIVKSLVQAFDLAKPKSDAGIGFTQVDVNYPALNAFVLYVATQALATSKPPKLTTNSGDKSNEISVHFDRDSTHLALIAQLMGASDAELRYFLCSAMANQLRYPNSHTHFYSCVILTLFAHPFSEDVKQTIQHIITRVLLERIICNRPHPVSAHHPSFFMLYFSSNDT
jgi:CCR4-NOT transcription complex subunit 1